MPRIIVPDDYPPVLAASPAFTRLGQLGEVRYYDSLPGGALAERIADADVVVNIRSSSRFTAEIFRAAPRLRLLSLWGTGTDNVDLAAAAAHGVTVTNTPGVAARSIAEHALALMLASARRIPRLDAETRAGAWPRGQSIQLRGRTLGIAGLGAIGREFARMGQAIGMRVIAWTFHPDPALGFELVERNELLRRSDVLSLHLRLSADTRGFLGRREIAMMKPGAILVNTARGGLVDQAALVEALAAGRLAGAGLDVFETEPLPPGDAITRLANAVLTPHCAGITPEALAAGLEMAVGNVAAYLAGRPEHVVAGAVPSRG